MTLLARLQSAERGDRGLDGEMDLLFPPTNLSEAIARRDYTTSLDAALALAERVLPGCGWQVLVEPGHGENGFSYAAVGDKHVALPGIRPALALCCAVLSVMEQDT